MTENVKLPARLQVRLLAGLALAMALVTIATVSPLATNCLAADITLSQPATVATAASSAATTATTAATGSAAAAGSVADADKPLAILKRYFVEPEGAARARLAQEFAAVAPRSWPEQKRLLHQAAVFPEIKPGDYELKTTAAPDRPVISYVLRVPAGYRWNEGRAWPLVIGCHGAGGTGRGSVGFVERVLGPDLENYIVACPDSPDGGLFGASQDDMLHPSQLLQELRHVVNLDSDRAVLLGYSRGGYTAWGAAFFSPGEWAGVLPMACSPLTDGGRHAAPLYLDNVMNLNLQAHWGANDIEPGQKEGINTLSREIREAMRKRQAAKYEGLEYAGQGHQLDLQMETIRKFIAASRRQPFPDDVKMTFHHLWQGRLYYLQALAATRPEFDFKAQVTVKVNRPEEYPQALRDLLYAGSYGLSGKYRKSDNTLTILGRNISEVAIELGA